MAVKRTAVKRNHLLLWVVIGIAILCLSGGLFGSFFALPKIGGPIINLPLPAPPRYEGNVPLSPTETPTLTPTPAPQKVLFPTDMGSAFWPLDPEGKKFISYDLGFIGTPPGNYPFYDFPLFISRSAGGQPYQTIATIQDPGLKNIGDKWETTTTDTEYNVLCKVRLTRIREDYKYKTEFLVSPDYGIGHNGERQWLPPLTFPPD